jgi:hypothetical protein
MHGLCESISGPAAVKCNSALASVQTPRLRAATWTPPSAQCTGSVYRRPFKLKTSLMQSTAFPTRTCGVVMPERREGEVGVPK